MSPETSTNPRGHETKLKAPPCLRCKGSGREVTAIEDWEHVEYLLRTLMWPETRIKQFRNSLRRGDIVYQLRALSVEIQTLDSRRRTFFKEPGVRQ